MKKAGIGEIYLLVIFILICVLIVESELQAKNAYRDTSKYLDLSLQYYPRIHDKDVQQETLKYITNYHLSRNHFSEVDKLVGKLADADDKIDIYCKAAIRLHSNHEETKAKKYLDRAKQALQASIPLIDDLSKKLAEHLGQDKIKGQEDVIKQAISWRFNRNSYANYQIAKTLIAMGDIDSAQELISEMKKAPSEEQWDDFAITSLASEQLTKNSLSEAFKTVKTISADDLRDKAYMEIAEKLIHIKQIEKIEQVVKEIKDICKRERTIGQLAVYHLVQGDNASKEKAINRITTLNGKLHVYSILAIKSKETGKSELGRQYLKEARGISGNIVFEKRSDQRALLKNMNSTKNPDEWLKMAKQLHESSENIVSDYERDFVYYKFIKAQLVFDFIEEACQDSLKLTVATHKNKALADISLYYIKQGKNDLALSILKQISNEFVLRETYYLIGKTIAKLQNWNEIDFWENISKQNNAHRCLLYLGIAEEN